MFAKLIYALIFTILIPFLLIRWIFNIEATVSLPVLFAPTLGISIFFVASLIMFLGMIALFKYGNGLPMNAFPPEKFVKEGIYKWFSHPIYVGASFLTIGLSMVFGSAAGLWLISPLVIFGCIAIVLGYERQDLIQRFGLSDFKARLSIPKNSEEKAHIWNRISVYVLVFIPWLILYQIVIYFGISPVSISSYFPFEAKIPVYENWEVFYISVYPMLLIVPFILKTQAEIRHFMISALVATALGIFIHLTVPLIAIPREFVPTNLLGELLLFEQKYDSPVASFPSFHVFWAFLAAYFLAKRFNRIKSLFYTLAILISLSCILTSMHSIVDVIAGYLLYLLTKNPARTWEKLRSSTEQFANSWNEWNFGKIRLINHGLYAGLAAFIGILIVGVLLGEKHYFAILITATSSIVFAAIWAQIVEGSESLLRPFGYYGNVIGMFIGAAISNLFLGSNFYLLLAAFAIGGTVIQAIGRLRCLIQGCCHGRESSSDYGIRYQHEKSRVTRISNMRNRYLYPTPLYSMIANLAIGILLFRLWISAMPLPFILGIYLILSGLTRFVEEDYRGEVQTPRYYGLRLYQWIAIISVLIGAYCTTLFSGHPRTAYEFSWTIFNTALGMGIISCIAYGVDFPGSSKKFSKLV